MRTAEHILLESDIREVPDRRAARKVHARIALRSRLRRRFLQLEIIDYYYLAVRSRSRSRNLEYVLDLRFVDMPRVQRHVAWRWITASVACAGLAYLALRFGGVVPAGWQGQWPGACAALIGAWAVTTVVAFYRTTETVRLHSTVGAAILLQFTGELVTLRGLRRFFTGVGAHVRLATSDRRRTKAAHLRDEMREHTRLRELGVLREAEYEAAKARILGRHSGSSAAGAPASEGRAVPRPRP